MVDTIASFNPEQHLMIENIAADNWQHQGLVQIPLKCSKTDPSRKGADVVLGVTPDELCPVKALFGYLQLRSGASGPLFMHQDSIPLNHSVFVKAIRSTLDELGYTNPLQYSGHSFRAGAATTAAAMNDEDSIIKTLGR